jgi:hypothetical protein
MSILRFPRIGGILLALAAEAGSAADSLNVLKATLGGLFTEIFQSRSPFQRQ